MADLVDALGIPLAEHWKWLPDRVAMWPTPKKIVDKEAARRWKTSLLSEIKIVDWVCWWCQKCKWDGNVTDIEVHHMARISHHDASWNFALLCSVCHRHDGEAVKAESLYHLLTLKHKYDRQNCSWIHLALGLGRRLPTEDA